MLKKLIYFTLYLFVSFVIIPCFSQDNTSESTELDVSDKNLHHLYDLEDFYTSQLKKGTVDELLRDSYKLSLTNARSEIAAIKKQRLDYAKRVSLTEPTLLEQEKFNFQFRDLDVALSAKEPPAIYAYELKSIVINAGVSFLSTGKYSSPFTISGEKSLNEKFGVGAYLGHFIEKVTVSQEYPDSNQYLAAYLENYKHNYFNVGLMGSYHFFKPDFFLSVEHFDLYAKVHLGYTLSASTFPFLSNEPYLPYDEEGNEVIEGQQMGKFLKPTKSGINYGAFGGLRYMYDDYLGFFIEGGYSNTAFVTGGITIRLIDKNTLGIVSEESIEFKVKIISSEKRKKLTSKSFKGQKGIEEYIFKKQYYYVLIGENTSYGAATILCAQLKESKKFKKSEVIAIKNGEKLIPLQKAIKALQKNLVKTVTVPGTVEDE
jgi:hypothetical protein